MVKLTQFRNVDHVISWLQKGVFEESNLEYHAILHDL